MSFNLDRLNRVRKAQMTVTKTGFTSLQESWIAEMKPLTGLTRLDLEYRLITPDAVLILMEMGLANLDFNRRNSNATLIHSLCDRDSFDECWEWCGSFYSDGYGQAQSVQDAEGRIVRMNAQRLVWKTLMDPDKIEGMHIDHLCRNVRCVNPLHLAVVTPKENISRNKQEDCGKCDLPLLGDNLYVYTDKKGYEHRVCVNCRRAADRRFKEKKRLALSA